MEVTLATLRMHVSFVFVRLDVSFVFLHVGMGDHGMVRVVRQRPGPGEERGQKVG